MGNPQLKPELFVNRFNMQNSQVTDYTAYIRVIQNDSFFCISGRSVWHNKKKTLFETQILGHKATLLDIGSLQNATIPNEIKQKRKK